MTDFELFVRVNKLKKKDIAAYLGVSSAFITQLSSGDRQVPSDKLALIKANADWDTSMLSDGLRLSSEAVVIEHPKLKEVPLLSKYAYAGYLSGFGDTEYVDTLPTMPFILPEEQTARGEYLAIEVKGDSMDNGTDESLKDGDILLCRRIHQQLWANYKLHIRKWNFVIVCNDGIVVKRIIDHNIENHTITIHSLNDLYEDRVLDLAEVREIFNVVQFTRQPIV